MSLFREDDINKIVMEQADISVRNRQQIRDTLIQCQWLYESADDLVEAGMQSEDFRYRSFVVHGDRKEWLLLISAVSSTLTFILTAPASLLSTIFGVVGGSTACFAAVSDIVKRMKKEDVRVFLDITEYIQTNRDSPKISDLEKIWPKGDIDQLTSALNQLIEKRIVQHGADDKLYLKV